MSINRREMLTQSGRALAATSLAATSLAASGVSVANVDSKRKPREPFGYCFNTSTIRGQKLSLDQQVEITAKAGYQAIEPWVGDIGDYQRKGGSLSDLKKKIADLGLTVESAIGFAQWIVDDEKRRAKGLEDARRDMDLVHQIGGIRIAAPPTGATRQTDLNLLEAAKRYYALLKVGDSIGVVPQVEVWGFSKSLSRLGETVFVAIECGHPKACILPDVYHVYKGGSDFAGLGLLNGQAIQIIHLNDYPVDPPRETISDADRVYPGDGVAPISSILRLMHKGGFRGMLSLELFNPKLWKKDPLEVAKTGLSKMQTAVKKAFG